MLVEESHIAEMARQDCKPQMFCFCAQNPIKDDEQDAEVYAIRVRPIRKRDGQWRKEVYALEKPRKNEKENSIFGMKTKHL